MFKLMRIRKPQFLEVLHLGIEEMVFYYLDAVDIDGHLLHCLGFGFFLSTYLLCYEMKFEPNMLCM